METLNIAAVILAGGQSSRFGADNKLFALYKGVPLVDHCLNSVCATRFDDRIIVTGFEHERVETHIEGLPLRLVFNSEFANGLGSSLAAGVSALGPECDAFMVFLADMPDLTPALILEIITAYETHHACKTIVRSTHNGKPGHPVLFSAVHKRELKFLPPDQGAFDVIQKHKTSTLNVEVNSFVVLHDVDRVSDLAH